MLLILDLNSLQAISAVLRLLSLIAIVAAIDEVVRAVGIPENRKHNKVDEYGQHRHNEENVDDDQTDSIVAELLVFGWAGAWLIDFTQDVLLIVILFAV